MVDIPAPAPKGAQVTVAMEAFGVGIHDRNFIKADGPFPYVIGVEGSGIVSALGPDVTGIEIGPDCSGED
ncbi:MAG: alcohol dehydrogenase catalytic domain-containing protein [Aquihabitans sp.]